MRFSVPPFGALVLGLCLGVLLSLPLHAATLACYPRGAYSAVLRPGETLTVTGLAGLPVVWAGGRATQIDRGAGFAPAAGAGQAEIGASGRLVIRESAGGGVVQVSCGLAAALESGAATPLSPHAQLAATAAAVTAATAERRAGRAGFSGGPGGVRVSTRGDGSLRTGIWSSLRLRGYTGSYAGQAHEILGGADLMGENGFLVGILAGYGRTFAQRSGQDEQVDAPQAGVYFGQGGASGQVAIDGFVSRGWPRFATDGARFGGSRLTWGLTIRGGDRWPGAGRVWRLVPVLAAQGYDETRPAHLSGGGAVVAERRLSHRALSLGLRLSADGGGAARGPGGRAPRIGGLVPSLGVALDYARFEDSATGTQVVVAPRLSVGLAGRALGGEMRIDLDIGRSQTDGADAGLRMDYALRF